MTRRSFVVHLPLCILLWISKTFSECPYKECVCSVNAIACEYKRLNAIPKLVTNDSTGFPYLLFDSNSITTVPADSLPWGLVSISFTHNPIATIDVFALNGSSSTLTTLRFDGANFTRIPDALSTLNVLKSLYISNTYIQDWNDEVMEHLGLTLKTLSLENNGLTTWPNWLRNYTHLTNLRISNSNMSFIPDGSFDLLNDSLTSLTLNRNRLTEIPKALTSLASLKILSLNNNWISNVTWLPHASKLITVELSFNKISDADQLSSVLQRHAGYLAGIHIDNNLLTKIPDFHFLKGIGRFDFGHNLISDPNSGSMPLGVYAIHLDHNLLPSTAKVLLTMDSITNHFVSWNNITQIRGTDIPTSITGITIDHNLITELKSDCFPEKSNINYLRLNNNPISTISIDAFKNVPKLSLMYLGGTQITRLPLAFSALTSIQLLDLTGNDKLVCTCYERSLAPWVRIFNTINLMGQCGEIRIYDFFMKMSPACPSESPIVG